MDSRELVKNKFLNGKLYDKKRSQGGVRYEVQYVLSMFERILPQYQRQWQVLEIGAGTGFATLIMLKHGYRLIATDVNKPMLDELQRKVSGSELAERCQIQIEDVFSLSFADESFDFICCTSVIPRFRNLDDQKAALTEIARVLKPGGKLLFNYSSSQSLYYYKTKYGNLLSPKEMKEILHSLGLKVISRRSTHLLQRTKAKKWPIFVTRLCIVIDRILEKWFVSVGWNIFVLVEKTE